MDCLNKRILRFILKDYNYPILYIRRPQKFLVILYKNLNYPGYLSNLFTLRSIQAIVYVAIIPGILSLPNPKTTNYGPHSFLYLAAKLWKSLLDSFRTSSFTDFKRRILNYDSFQ